MQSVDELVYEHMLLSRRQSLRLFLGSLLSSIALEQSCVANSIQPIPLQPVQRSIASNGNQPVTANAALQQLASNKGILYGASAKYPELFSDSEIRAQYARECAVLVPENELKLGELRRRIGQFNFDAADWMVDFAETNNISFRGHTLLWNQSIPPWLTDYATRQNAEQLMTEHIKTVMERYAGKMHSWDVVNEVVQLGQSNHLMQSLWLDRIGPDYIELAFRIAAEVDPNTLLVFNENRFEYESRNAGARQEATLNLLSNLKARGTPIHALGIQGHLWGHLNHDINYTRYREFLRNIADLGLKILITELDVVDQELSGDINDRDRIVADAYEAYLTAVLDEPAVIAVITWGLSDRYTWVSRFFPRSDNLPVRPLPFDTELNRKPAWTAIARAFDQAPAR